MIRQIYDAPSGAPLNDQLYPLVIAGDKTARQRMIENNLDLVRRRVEARVRRKPGSQHLFDDMVGAGCLALVEAVDSLSAGVENVTGYLTTSIANGIGRCILELRDGASIASSTYSDHKKEAKAAGEELVLPNARQLGRSYFAPPDEENELWEEIMACCKTDNDRRIVELRVEGLTDKEIGSQLGISRLSVQRARKSIERRFVERDNWFGPPRWKNGGQRLLPGVRFDEDNDEQEYRKSFYSIKGLKQLFNRS